MPINVQIKYSLYSESEQRLGPKFLFIFGGVQYIEVLTEICFKTKIIFELKGAVSRYMGFLD